MRIIKSFTAEDETKKETFADVLTKEHRDGVLKRRCG